MFISIPVKPDSTIESDYIASKSERYVNTEQIRDILFLYNPTTHSLRCWIYFTDSRIETTEAAGRYILTLSEANDALLDNNTNASTATVNAPAVALTTRIAQTLRDTWQRASMAQLLAIFSRNADVPALEKALQQLIDEQVVRTSTDTDGTTYFYHASHRARYEPTTLTTPCPACNGKGRDSQIPDSLCYFCNGTGTMVNDQTLSLTATKQHKNHAVTTVRYSFDEGELVCGTCGCAVCHDLQTGQYTHEDATLNLDPLPASEAPPSD